MKMKSIFMFVNIYNIYMNDDFFTKKRCFFGGVRFLIIMTVHSKNKLYKDKQPFSKK